MCLSGFSGCLIIRSWKTKITSEATCSHALLLSMYQWYESIMMNRYALQTSSIPRIALQSSAHRLFRDLLQALSLPLLQQIVEDIINTLFFKVFFDLMEIPPGTASWAMAWNSSVAHPNGLRSGCQSAATGYSSLRPHRGNRAPKTEPIWRTTVFFPRIKRIVDFSLSHFMMFLLQSLYWKHNTRCKYTLYNIIYSLSIYIYICIISRYSTKSFMISLISVSLLRTSFWEAPQTRLFRSPRRLSPASSWKTSSCSGKALRLEQGRSQRLCQATQLSEMLRGWLMVWNSTPLKEDLKLTSLLLEPSCACAQAFFAPKLQS